jgi:putative CocE/NonD family hydrolase
VSIAARLARRLWRLPEPRCEVWPETLWLPTSDGTRLATLHLWPVGVADAPTLAIRTADGALRAGRATRLLAWLAAQRGHHVLLQDVRGRYDSEGRFEPFRNEGRDGRELLEWAASQGWCDPTRIAVAGMGYAGFAAWAALGEAPEHVAAIAVAFATSDPYLALHPGGAFALATALEWSVALGERERVSGSRLDLERAVLHRPAREADRVALRRSDAYRAWADHPRRDAVWDAIRARLPATPPPALLLAGWWDACLDAQLRDYELLAEAARAAGSAPPRIVLGPWPGVSAPVPGRRAGPFPSFPILALAELTEFLDRSLRGTDAPAAGARYAVAGAGFREAPAWPPAESQPRALYLRSGGHAGADGSLAWEAAGDEPPDRFRYDPASPLPSPVRGLRPGTQQRGIHGRPDLLSYTSAPLERDLVIAGPLRAVLYAESSAPDTDFTATLLHVGPDDRSACVAEGIARARWRGRGPEEKEPVWLEPGQAVRIDVDLGAAAWRVPAGHRLRLLVSSSSVPRFDRNANAREEPAACGPEAARPAEQVLHHSTERPSHLLLPVTGTHKSEGTEPSPPSPLLATSGACS